jgi:hypothetical protein
MNGYNIPNKNIKRKKSKKIKNLMNNIPINIKEEEIISILPRNVVREFLNNVINKDLKSKILGSYYLIIHSLIMYLGMSIILFSNNIYHLFAILLFVSVDALSVVILHDCPITLLEKKYLDYSMAQLKEAQLKEYNIVYKDNHLYETQIELLINLASIIILKILVLIFMDLFNIQHPNYPEIFLRKLLKKYIYKN